MADLQTSVAVTDAALVTTDVTTNDASTTKHGFLKKLDNTATNFMNGAGNWAAPASATEYDVLEKIGTAVAVTNTVTDTALVNFSIVANTHGTDKKVVLACGGDWNTTSGGAVALPRFLAKFGSGPTTVLDSGALASIAASSASRFPWRIVVEWEALDATNSQWMRLSGGIYCARNGAVSNALFGTGTGVVSSFCGAGTYEVGGYEGGAASAADTTAAQALILSVILPSATTTDIIMKYANIAVIG